MKTMSLIGNLFILLGIITIIITVIYVAYIQIQNYKQTEDYCNNQYGFNNWEFNETTETNINKYYIGQVWECIPLSNSTKT